MTGVATQVNPLALLAVGLAGTLGSLGVDTLPEALALATCWLVVVALASPSWRHPAFCLALVALPVVSVAWSTWMLGGRDPQTTALAAVRIFVLAWPGAVAVGYVDVARLGDYLAQTLRVPARFASALSVALQRVGGTWRAWHDIARARRARGLRRGPGAMAFAVLVHTMREASRTSIAMDARGFAAARRRTWAEPASWTRVDVGAVLLAAVLAVTPHVM